MDDTSRKQRGLADPIGFAHTEAQITSILERIATTCGDDHPSSENSTIWRVAISPHDDYSYVGSLYPDLLRNVRARTVILFGVAHKARALDLENELIFDSFSHWHGPYGAIPVSPVRDALIASMPADTYQVNDEMQSLEHSLEALLPFLQHYNRDIEIVPILVPQMSFARMEELSAKLAAAIARIIQERDWEWGTDVAIVISNDAVHYGDEGWGGKDFARYGTDEQGNRRALEHDREIIDACLIGELEHARIQRFTEYTLDPDDYREYRWTWCGRYAVPFGLLTALRLQQLLGAAPISSELVGYGTSIDGRPHIPVDDIGLGVTAPATQRHWVGYLSLGFR